MEVKISKENTTNVELSNKNSSFYLDYGINRYAQDLKTIIEVNTTELLTFHSTCGCTIPEMVKTENGYKGYIVYDSKRLGTFAKTIKINRGKTTVGTITVRGNIIK